MLAVPILNNSTCQPNSTHVLPPLVQVVPEQEPLAVVVKVLEVGTVARDHVAFPYDVQEDLPLDVREAGLHAVIVAEQLLHAGVAIGDGSCGHAGPYGPEHRGTPAKMAAGRPGYKG